MFFIPVMRVFKERSTVHKKQLKLNLIDLRVKVFI